MDIDDENITTTGLLQPPRMGATDPPTTMTGAIHVIKLRKLWSKYSTHLYPVCPTDQGADLIKIVSPHAIERAAAVFMIDTLFETLD